MLNSDSLHIRIAVESDAPALADFAARTFEETFGPHNRPEDLRAHLNKAFGIAQQTQELLNPNMVTLLGFNDATLLAFAQVKRQGPPPAYTSTRRSNYIASTSIAPLTAKALRNNSCAPCRPPRADSVGRPSGSASGNATHAPSPSTKKPASSTAAATISS